jgi:hypothetical protein
MMNPPPGGNLAQDTPEWAGTLTLSSEEIRWTGGKAAIRIVTADNRELRLGNHAPKGQGTNQLLKGKVDFSSAQLARQSKIKLLPGADRLVISFPDPGLFRQSDFTLYIYPAAEPPGR